MTPKAGGYFRYPRAKYPPKNPGIFAGAPESGSFPIRQTPGKSCQMDPPDLWIRGFGGWNPGGKGRFISDFTPLMRIPAASPDPIKRGEGVRPGP